MHALIDGDILVYRAGFAAQHTQHMLVIDDQIIKEFEIGVTKNEVKKEQQNYAGTEIVSTIIEYPVTFAIQSIKKILRFILDSTGANSYSIFLTSSDRSNYRFKIAKTPGSRGEGYKAGRPEKPIHYQACRDYLIKHCNAEVISNQEADDELGIKQTKDTIICSIDKDLLMVPGKHFNIVTGESVEISDFQGYKNFCKQLLIGDNADNIPGIMGIGKIRAEKLLKNAKNYEEMLAIVKKVYYTNFKDDAERRLLEIGQLLWIRRKPQELWCP